ncbi:PCC domain-containing protein [Nocardia tengchongensis]|uniref:PCC domain-containing protein n=1 Tax=Nocardia tengchongensis TaxID=2055889 RepID=UPI0036B0DEB4
MHVFEVKNGELLAELAAQAQEAGIRDAAIVSLIGAADEFTISTMPADDALADNISRYALPAEMHGCGEIKDGVVHIHATMAVQGDRAVAGHLHAATIGAWFARAYVLA